MFDKGNGDYRTQKENAVFEIFRKFTMIYDKEKGTADGMLPLLSLLVGAARLERATACTPCKNASQLHHAPISGCKDREFFVLQTKNSLSLHQKNNTYINI